MKSDYWKHFTALSFALVLVLSLGVSCADEDDDSDDTADDSDDEEAGGERLLAAIGQAALTPDARNHPETIYLGGVFPSRLASGVHDDLLATALILEQGDEQVVLISLDFLGFTRTRIREIQERLSYFGFAKEHILISSTHTHEAPDTIGVFGPNVLTSGVSPTYMRFVQKTIVDLVLDTRDQLTPVNMRAVKAQVNDPASNYPTLIADARQPQITVDYLSAVAFTDDDGQTVASLVNWHSHPEVMIESTLISADFPRWVRQAMEEKLGGGCIYLSGAIGGLATPTGVEVPARDEAGNPLTNEDGSPLYLLDGSWDKARSLGYVIAEIAVAGLEATPEAVDPELSVTVEELLLPVTNPIMKLAFLTGLAEYDDQDLDKGHRQFCGRFGCASERLGLVRLGPLTLLTSPGETFPETVIGREETSIDFGGDFGVFVFPEIAGLDAFIVSPVPVHMSVCGDEVGYLIPEADFHAKKHPDYYEEDLYFGKNSETIYRQAAIELLAK